MIQLLRKLLNPECFKYGVHCKICKASFGNLSEHEIYVKQYTILVEQHKNKVIEFNR
jgi:hypothetical protein